MSDRQRYEELWTAFLEGELTPDSMHELQELLSDAELLADAASSYRLHRMLGAIHCASDREEFVGEVMAALPAGSNGFVDGVMSAVVPDAQFSGAARSIETDRPAAGKNLLSRSAWLLAAAAAVVLLFLVLFRPHSDGITVVDVGGDVTLTGDSGRVVSNLSAGHSFDGGTLEASSADAWIRLRFADRSTVTLSGRSLATVSQSGQKLLNLRHGTLSADIFPQGAGAPMLVHTPTAEMKVVGTQFQVGADASRTRLVVHEGLVSLTRRSDGSSTEVHANHQVAATAVTNEELSVSRRRDATSYWQADLENDIVFGKWMSDYEVHVARLKKLVDKGELSEEEAFARLSPDSDRDAGGSLFALPWFKSSGQSKDAGEKTSGMQLAILSISTTAPGPVVGDEQSMMRIRGRVYRNCSVSLGISANELSGGFAGKYRVRRSLESGGGDEFALEIPLSEFSDGFETPAGKELVEWWILTDNIESKIEILEVELTDSQSR